MRRDALPPPARWPAQLRLSARREGAATRVHDSHHGPLRLLKSLYPEGPGIAHAVLVHPPGGLVGGDRLDIAIEVQPGAHLLATTPAATRFYRSASEPAAQVVQARVAAGARLEWLPQETLAYRGCRAVNELHIQLQGDAAVMASELLALGLPEAGQPFDSGELLQHLELQGLWRDRGRIAAADRALLDGPCGLAGRRVLGTLLLAQGEPLPAGLMEPLLEASRALSAQTPGVQAGLTLLQGRLLLLRLLADELEPAQLLMRRMRLLWRRQVWGLADSEPRIWAT